MTSVIVARHSAGKWLRASTPEFDASVHRMRHAPTRARVGVSWITRTEGAEKAANESLRAPHDRFGVFQPENKVGGGLTDCSIEFNQDLWRLVDGGVEVLTSIRIKTQHGFLLPPSQMPWAIFEPVDPQWASKWKFKRALVSTAHNNLDNTPTRSRAWRSEGDSFVQFQLRHRAPTMLRYHCADLNKDFKNKHERDLGMQYFVKPAQMSCGWASVYSRIVAGTHDHALLDWACANAKVRAWIMKDDASSDHRPEEVQIS